MNGDTQLILDKINQFRVDMAGRLGSIEARLNDHAAHGLRLEETVHDLEIDAEVSKKVGKVAGARWGVGAGAILIGLAEALRQWLGF